MKKYPIYAAMTQSNLLYGLELDQSTFETYAMSAYLKIGNHDYRTYRTKIYPQEDPDGGWSVEKPCNLDAIEAITLNFEDFQNTSSIVNYPGVYTSPIEQNIERRKVMPHELYIPGKLVKFKELGDKIYFTEPFAELNLLYKGWYTDEDGFPYLNEKEVEAIALYCAYTEHYKKGIVSKDQTEITLAQMLKKDWLQACKAARIPESISQNELNEIMDTFVRRDIHRFGKTTKLVL